MAHARKVAYVVLLRVNSLPNLVYESFAALNCPPKIISPVFDGSSRVVKFPADGFYEWRTEASLLSIQAALMWLLFTQ